MSLDPDQLEISSLINDNTGQSVSLDAFPTWNDDNCSQIAVTWEDDVFEVVPDACFKILRHWKLIDWCQYDPVTGCGLWEYTQTIKVLDDVEPEFPNCEDVTFCDSAAVGCTGLADLVLEVQECTPDDMLKASYRIFAFEDADEPDFCNNFVDLDVQINEITNRATVTRTGVINSPVPVVGGDVIQYTTDGGATFRTYTSPFLLPDEQNDVLIIRTVQYEDGCDTDITFYGLSLDATRYYPFGTHRIQWYVEDMCGNWNTCDIDFTVEDCKKPSPVCLGISSVLMPVNGVVELDARYFDAASFDNCTSNEDLIFSFSSDTTETTMEFTCDDLGTNEVTIWVTDENGNQDFCSTFVIIDDNNQVCGDISSTIAGWIETEMGESVADVLVNVESPMNVPSYTTTEDGLFHFYDLDDFNDYEIVPNKNVNPLNGVTTYDLALIQRHILQIDYLDSAYKLIAADANNDEQINILDIIDIRKLILGLTDEFTNNTSWRFVDADQTFPGGLTTVPSDINESIMYQGLYEDQMETDFIGVKVGDVNNSAEGNDAAAGDSRNLEDALKFISGNIEFEAGQEVRMDVRAANFEQVLGYQFTFGFDISKLRFEQIVPGVLDVTDGNFGTHQSTRGFISTSWNDVNPISYASDDILFTIVFTGLENGSLKSSINVNSAITMTEAYNAQGSLMNVEIGFEENGLIESDVFALYQNNPNPFIETTWIGFNLPEAADATFTIFDVTGRTVKQFDGDYSKGFNQIQLDKSDIGSPGVYYYQLQTEGYSATKKMVIE
jgi:hypothetical protein